MTADEQDIQPVLPIRPPDEPMQYRAIGVVRGTYTPIDDQITRGNLTLADGTSIDAVLLGRVMGIVKKNLELSETYHWVVYPRTRDKQPDGSRVEAATLHLQIVGVWEPELLGRPLPEEPVAVDVFSIRGEIIFQSPSKVVVKIRQAPRGEAPGKKRPLPFKLQLKGALNQTGLGQFWDFQVMRQGQELVILDAIAIGELPRRPSPKPRRRPTPPPTIPSSDTTPTPKPIIRRKSDQ